VHGKRSILAACPATTGSALQSARLLQFMFGHPGKKLLSWAARSARRAMESRRSLQWHLLEQKKYAASRR